MFTSARVAGKTKHKRHATIIGMSSKSPALPTRPYWHVDLKWVFGLLALFTLGSSLLLFNLSALTERDRAIEVSATVVASLFSKEGLDDASGLQEFRQMAAAAPGDNFAPIEQYPNIQISKNDALTLSPRDLRIAIFSQLTAPIYDKGLEGAAAEITQDPAEQEKFASEATLLGVFTKSAHEILQRIFYVSAGLALISIAAATYFSAGLGRLVTPSVLLLATSPVGAVAGLMLLNPPQDGDSPFAALPSTIAREIGSGLTQSYTYAALLGVLLLTAALALKIIKRMRNPQNTAKNSTVS